MAECMAFVALLFGSPFRISVRGSVNKFFAQNQNLSGFLTNKAPKKTWANKNIRPDLVGKPTDLWLLLVLPGAGARLLRGRLGGARLSPAADEWLLRKGGHG